MATLAPGIAGGEKGRFVPPSRRRPSKEVVRRDPALPARRGGQNRVEVLIDQGSTLLRNYLRVETSKTSILAELARVVVELRAHFTLQDGTTDWDGRSHGYREAIARVYRDAGIPADSLSTIQASIRYHVSNVLREVAPPEELEDKGLRKETARERVKETRDRTMALARATLALGGSGSARADVSRLIIGAEALLGRVEDAALDDVPPERLAELAEVLEALAGRISELRAAIRKRTRRRR